LRCALCDEKLIEKTVVLHYLDYDFNVNLPCCPLCGQVFIDEDTTRERIARVEVELEDK
jgi:hypothetical protein